MTADPLPPLKDLLTIMATLRAPDGCPWDRAQTLETLKPFLLEETYEVLDAMDGPRAHLCEELGDLLLQIVFQAQIAAEEGSFSFGDVASSIAQKMRRRHPHVFGSEKADSPEAVREQWERHKRLERRQKNASASVLDGIPPTLPALLHALRLGEKASRVGFDWPSKEGVLTKLDEELAELDEAITRNNVQQMDAEMGDVLLTLVNLCRFLKLNPEESLRRANQRFDQRFRKVEARIREEGRAPEQLTLDELERHWQNVKLRLAADSA